MVDHSFGGPWTEIKLDAVAYYLECYTKALTRIGFDLWYVDAFAGSGDRTQKREVGGIFEQQPLSVVTETLAGSARRALEINPPFRHFVFNESHPERHAALRKLKDENPTRDIQVLDGEANKTLTALFNGPPWLPPARGKARGVVFLDPYAMQVNWQTLELLSRTKAVDVWYLFPLRDVTRQLALKKSGVGPKAPKLDAVLSPRWHDLYSLPPPERSWKQTSLFGEKEEAEEERTASQKQIEEWFKTQLETIFPFASDPLPLLTGQTRQLFSLFLAVANPSKPAVDLAKHFHSYVMKNFAPGASRQTSGRGATDR